MGNAEKDVYEIIEGNKSWKLKIQKKERNIFHLKKELHTIKEENK